MNDYELILLFDPNLGEEKIKQLVSKVEEKIKDLGGMVEKVDFWGSRKLASRVRKAKWMTNGYYVLLLFKGKSDLPSGLCNYLRVTENIIRYYIARAKIAAGVPVGEEKEIAGTPLELKKEGIEIGES